VVARRRRARGLVVVDTRPSGCSCRSTLVWTARPDAFRAGVSLVRNTCGNREDCVHRSPIRAGARRRSLAQVWAVCELWRRGRFGRPAGSNSSWPRLRRWVRTIAWELVAAARFSGRLQAQREATRRTRDILAAGDRAGDGLLAYFFFFCLYVDGRYVLRLAVGKRARRKRTCDGKGGY